MSSKNLSEKGSGAVMSAMESSSDSNYKVVSISLYKENIEHLNRLVDEAKRMGKSKPNKSQIIRAALKNFKVESLPDRF